jgi:hypothetical protein
MPASLSFMPASLSNFPTCQCLLLKSMCTRTCVHLQHPYLGLQCPPAQGVRKGSLLPHQHPLQPLGTAGVWGPQPSHLWQPPASRSPQQLQRPKYNIQEKQQSSTMSATCSRSDWSEAKAAHTGSSTWAVPQSKQPRGIDVG